MAAMTRFSPETPWHERPRAAFDLETTGKYPLEARIVTASLVLMSPDDEVIEAAEWLADPGIEIPEEAAAIYGVTTERARADGQPVKEVVADVWKTMERFIYDHGSCAVAFNASYDFTVMHQESVRHMVEPVRIPAVLDPYVLNKQMHRYRRGGRTLTDLCAEYGIDLTAAHTSAADSVAAAMLLNKFLAKWPDQLAGVPAGELHRKQVGWAFRQAESLEEYFRSEKAKEPDPNAVVDRGWPVNTKVDPMPSFEDAQVAK